MDYVINILKIKLIDDDDSDMHLSNVTSYVIIIYNEDEYYMHMRFHLIF